jgi:hypothetical protein
MKRSLLNLILAGIVAYPAAAQNVPAPRATWPGAWAADSTVPPAKAQPAKSQPDGGAQVRIPVSATIFS